MIGTTRAVQVWAYPKPADLHKGYNGLFGLVESELKRDPLSSAYYLNKRRSSCRVLHRDGTGLCLYCKRLGQGRFAKLWREEHVAVLQLIQLELEVFLEDCGLVGRRTLSPKATMRKRLANDGRCDHVKA